MPKLTEYKSSVFSMLLEDPKNCLQIYNALNGTNYDNPDDVIIKRLENGIVLSVRNDASFIIDAHLNIYEHQSTFSPNMPLRSLIYFVDLIRDEVLSHDIYSRKRISIPNPHFVVFYNGVENRPAKEILKLSSSYVHQDESPELELTCLVYNINVGYNSDFRNKCCVLHEYMIFVDKVRDYLAENMDIHMAIDLAIKDCINEHVLEDFLEKRGNEVRQVAALDYTFERREKLFRAEEHEDGRLEGLAEGLEKQIVILVCKKLRKSKTREQIADELEEDVNVINKICDVADKYAPEYDEELVAKEYLNK